MPALQVDSSLSWSALRLAPEDPRRSLQQLALPLCDLVGVHIELLGQLRQSLFTLQRRKGHLRLERRCVVPTGTSAHLLSSPQPSYGQRRTEPPLKLMSSLAEPPLSDNRIRIFRAFEVPRQTN